MRRELDCGGVPCLKLEFRRTDSGGQCLSGCHAPQSYAFAGALEPAAAARRRLPRSRPQPAASRPARAERARAQHQQELRHLPREGGEALRQGAHPRPGPRRRLQFLPSRPRAGEPADPPGPRGSHLRPLPRSRDRRRRARRTAATPSRAAAARSATTPTAARPRASSTSGATRPLRRATAAPATANRPEGGRSPGTSPRSAGGATTKSDGRNTRTAPSPPKAASAATGRTPHARRRCCAPCAPRSASPATRARDSRSRPIHDPVREGDCAACHPAHGAANEHLLVRPYPIEQYVPYAPERYGLCLECHDEGALTDPERGERHRVCGRDEEPARAAPARPGVALRTRDPRPARHHLPQLPRPACDRVAATDPPRARLQRGPLPPDRIQEDRRRRQVPRRLPHHPVLSAVQAAEKGPDLPALIRFL